MSERELTVTFKLNEPQWETVKRIAAFSRGWHWCNLEIRHDGEYKRFEADFMREFFEAVLKDAGIEGHW